MEHYQKRQQSYDQTGQSSSYSQAAEAESRANSPDRDDNAPRDEVNHNRPNRMTETPNMSVRGKNQKANPKRDFGTLRVKTFICTESIASNELRMTKEGF